MLASLPTTRPGLTNHGSIVLVALMETSATLTIAATARMEETATATTARYRAMITIYKGSQRAIKGYHLCPDKLLR